MTRWFRIYDEILDDPKVQLLSPELFKTWINVLAIASKNGGKLPSVRDMAFSLRLSVDDIQSRIDDLIMAGLIDILPGKKLEPHNWSKRQWKSDDSADRVRKHRAKKSQGSEANKETPTEPLRNDIVTVTVTPPDTDTDTDTDTESERKKVVEAPEPKIDAKPKAKTPRGARLQPDWALPRDWSDWTRINFAHATAEAIEGEADRFRDYWTAKSGQQAAKLDWQATWRNWCRTAFAARPATVRQRPAEEHWREAERRRAAEFLAICRAGGQGAVQ